MPNSISVTTSSETPIQSCQIRNFSCFRAFALAGVSIVVISLACSATIAQSLDETDTKVEDADNIELATIEVIARNRAEDQIDVPSSLTVRSAEQLSTRGLDGTRQAVSSVPNVTSTNPGVARFTRFVIRGAGSIGLDSPDDTSVAVNVNNIALPKHLADSLLFDLEQVEVLRGPQGTHFGQNSQAGAINVRTKMPEDRFAASIGGEWGADKDGHSRYNGTGMVNFAPVQGKIMTRLAGKWSQKDGNIKDLIHGGEVGNVDTFGLRSTTRIIANDSLDFLISADISRDDNDHPSWISASASQFPATSQANRDKTVQESYGLSLTGNYVFANDIELTSVTSYRNLESDIFTDNVDPLIETSTPYVSKWDEKFSKFGQEIRLATSLDNGVSWLAGVNLGVNDFDADIKDELNNGAITNYFDVKIENKTYGVFGELDIPFAERFKLSLGGRYNHDEKEADLSYRNSFAPGVTSQKAKKSWSAFTGKAALSVNWQEDLHSYISLARGWKPGGFNRYPVNLSLSKPELPFDETTSWTAELGTKASLMDGRAFVSGAVFYSRTSDEQIGSFDFATNSLKILNADTRSYGVELEGSIKPTDGLTLSGGLGFNHTRFAKDVAALSIRKGAKVPGVPGLTASARGQYDMPFFAFGRDLIWSSSASWSFHGSRQANRQNDLKLNSYHLVDAKTGISWNSGEAKSEVYLFGRNLFDESYETSAGYSQTRVKTIVAGEGRVLGLGAKLNF